jgi:hypothetical protein
MWNITEKLFHILWRNISILIQIRLFFNEIKDFIEKYNTTPTKEALAIQIQSKKGINAGDFKESIEFINNIDKDYEKTRFLIG